MPEPIKILPNRRTLIWQLVFSVLMLALSIFIIFTVHVIEKRVILYMGLAIGVIGPPAFIIATFFLLRKILGKVPEVIVDEEGLKVNTGLFYSAQVTWEDASEFGIVEFMRRKYFLVKMKDPEAHVNEVRGMEKRARAAYLKRFGTPFVISESTLDCKAEEFLEEINGFIKSRGTA